MIDSMLFIGKGILVLGVVVILFIVAFIFGSAGIKFLRWFLKKTKLDL